MPAWRVLMFLHYKLTDIGMASNVAVGEMACGVLFGYM